MPFLKIRQLKGIFFGRKTRSISIRRRFSFYVSSLFLVITSITLLLLNLFGAINPTGNKLRSSLDHQLESSADIFESDMDSLAAYALIFSEQMSNLIDKSLSKTGISFPDLKNNLNALTELQSNVFLTVYNNMRVADCSGAFYFLNTTANSTLEKEHYNGLYLKVTNLNSKNTAHNESVLYRGSAVVARENNMHLHSKWESETILNLFPEIDAMLKGQFDCTAKSYILTVARKLPDTWEHVRFLCVPILDDEKHTIGVCGFEINDFFFKFSYKTKNTEDIHMVCALLDETDSGFTGQIAGNCSGYIPLAGNYFTIEERQNITEFFSDTETFYGKSSKIRIGNSTHTLAVMLPEKIFLRKLRQGQFLAVGILLSITAIATCACIWLSKRYVTPIICGFEQLKANPQSRMQTNISEIADLFDFLAEKEQKYDAKILERKQELERLQWEKEKMEAEVARLAYSRKKEIDPDSYRLFRDSLHTLTVTERKIFDHYLNGKGTKEILALMNIKETTLKYHNRNIYNKLGVSSRKQLLLYASVIEIQPRNCH